MAGVVTFEGGFACHGANILRLAGGDIPWVASVNGQDQIRDGELVDASNGEIRRGYAEPNSQIAARAVWPEWTSRELVQWDLLNMDHISRCYWPHRTYDVLTQSIMIPGLEQSVRRIGNPRSEINTDGTGRIWFRNGPSSADLSQIAIDPRRSDPFIRDQLSAYDGLVSRIREIDDVADVPHRLLGLIDALESYFAFHLPFHDTYPVPLIYLGQALERDHNEAGNEVCEAVLAPPIVSWVSAQKGIRTSKDLLSDTVNWPLPESRLPPSATAQEHAVSMMNLARIRGFKDRGLLRLIDHCSRMVVIKEWSFTINKLLFSRFSVSCDELQRAGQLHYRDVRQVSIITISRAVRMICD